MPVNSNMGSLSLSISYYIHLCLRNTYNWLLGNPKLTTTYTLKHRVWGVNLKCIKKNRPLILSVRPLKFSETNVSSLSKKTTTVQKGTPDYIIIAVQLMLAHGYCLLDVKCFQATMENAVPLFPVFLWGGGKGL